MVDLTASGDYELEVHMWDWDELFAIARYKRFSITTNAHHITDYVLGVGDFSPADGDRDAGDSLGPYDGRRFSHKDRHHASSRCHNNYDYMPGW